MEKKRNERGLNIDGINQLHVFSGFLVYGIESRLNINETYKRKAMPEVCSEAISNRWI